MFRGWIAAVAAVMFFATSAVAQEVERAPVPGWVQAPLAHAPAPAIGDAAIRAHAIDHQIRFDSEGVHSYTFQRYEPLTRQGLSSVGTVSLVWSPAFETIQVHALRIIRGGQTIDILASQEFETLRRESNLESAMLDGRLTATLQPRDLRVGDILELAFTVHDSLGVLAPHLEAFGGPMSAETIDRYRLRATWSGDLPIRVEATTPWTDIRPRRDGDDWLYEIDVSNLRAENIPGDLPGRFNIARTVQFTDFSAWADASRLMAPLYERSAALEPDSTLLPEVERIRSAHATEAGRAAAALQLVQDEVRYLALSMGDGNYVPMSADEVWRSRYGDCKGKTVLLLALLKALGVEAEATLVSTRWGDGLDERLPMIGWFDHVIVRAVVDGQVYWMDGTRIGDRRLEDLIPPPYRWALPVRADGAGLEAIVQPPLTQPAMEVVAEVDASAGLDAEAPLVFDIAYRGDFATALRRQLGSIPADQLEAMLKSQIDADDASVTVESVETRYDEPSNVLHLILRGTTRLSWVNSPGGRVMAVPESALILPASAERRGILAKFADYPYAVTHPTMVRSVSRFRLPYDGRGFAIEGGDQTIEGGGYRLERRGALADGVAEIMVTATSLAPEVTAEEMAAVRKRAESASALPLRVRAPANYIATAADAARIDPGASDTAELVERARRLAAAGDQDGALALLDAAIEGDPENIEALKARGETRYAARDYAGARADYDLAVELDPADQAAALAQGVIAYAQGLYSDAVVSLSVALRLNPGDVDAMAMRGAAYYQMGRWERSLADYRALKTAAPGVPNGAYGELRALMRLGHEDEVRRLIAERLEEDPADGTALDALIRLETQNGSAAAALLALDRALETAPEAIELLGLRGRVRASVGDADGAREDFAAFRAADPGDPVLRNNVCWAQALEAFDLDQAMADCDVAAATGEAAYIDSRAMVLLQMERYAEALAEYDRALAAQPDLAPSNYGRGLARLALGDEGGREDIATALARDVDAAEDFAVFLARHPGLTD